MSFLAARQRMLAVLRLVLEHRRLVCKSMEASGGFDSVYQRQLASISVVSVSILLSDFLLAFLLASISGVSVSFSVN